MNRFFSKCIAGAALAAVLWSPISAQAGEVLDRVNANKVLKMATDANLPPLSFINDSNEMDGFDVSVGREIASRLGVELEIITPEWTMITAGHWNGRWDISIGSMTPTADRAKVFDFPAIYYYTPASFVVHKDSKIQTKTDLNGTVIGAPSGTTYEKYLRRDLVIDAVGTPEFKYEVEPGTIKTLSASTALRPSSLIARAHAVSSWPSLATRCSTRRFCTGWVSHAIAIAHALTLARRIGWRGSSGGSG